MMRAFHGQSEAFFKTGKQMGPLSAEEMNKGLQRRP
jgi:hypothetical protein